MNTTYNAFLLSRPPELSSLMQKLSMVRHLELEDDTKEYWGFYLLKGSSVTISTCSRFAGASLIVIRGHKHLHECAYIGDNSSEEIDELMEAIRESPGRKDDDEDAPTNDPNLIKRYREDVEFHDPLHKNSTKNHTLKSYIDISDITDTKMMRSLLLALKAKQEKNKKLKQPEAKEEHKHVHRNSTIAKDESNNVRITSKLTNKTASEEAFSDILKKLQNFGEKGADILNKVNKKYATAKDDQVYDIKGRHYSKPTIQYSDNIDNTRRKRELMLSGLSNDDEENDLAEEEVIKISLTFLD